MAKSKLTLSPSDLESRLDVTQAVFLMMDEVAHGATLGMVQRLLWEASFFKGEETEGILIGERAIDQLLDTMKLEDLLNRLDCICQAIGDSAGVDPYLYPSGTVPAGNPLATAWPTETENPTEHLYQGVIAGVDSWGKAKDHKCKLAQWWYDEYIGFLDWFITNNQTNQVGVDTLSGLLSAFLGGTALPATTLLDGVSAILGSLGNWAGTSKTTAQGNQSAIINGIWLAESPTKAAFAIRDLIGAPFSWPLIAFILQPVFRGEKETGNLIDVTGYSETYCAAPAGTWFFCAGNIASPLVYDQALAFSTTFEELAHQVQIQFDVPVRIVSATSDHGAFNFNSHNSLPASCFQASWDNFHTGQSSYADPDNGLVRAIRFFGPGDAIGGGAGWSGTITVSPI